MLLQINLVSNDGSEGAWKLINIALSAVAARKALKSTTSSPSKQNGDAIPRILGLPVESSAASVAGPVRPVDSLSPKAIETVEVGADASYSKTPTESEDGQASYESLRCEFTLSSSWLNRRYVSRANSLELDLERPSIGLSNFKPDKVNVHQLADGTISLRLEPGEVGNPYPFLVFSKIWHC